MKRIWKSFLAVLMAVLMGVMPSVKVFAAEGESPDYISEVKVFIGDYAAAGSEGYTILTDENAPVDLNQDAGGGAGSKGEKAVYLGYKTTKNRSEAITDLALMNMKGGYSVQEYEALMDKQLKSQILPFIENFRAAILEYRENYTSEFEANQKRALYVHDALNKLIDDDTGMPLGDLLLNETKQELGDAAYNALSDEQKKQHADLATILAQANGRATLIMESLISRAADTNEDTWLDRLVSLTYDKLEESTGLVPTDAKKQLAKFYDDDAQQILEMWPELKKHLDAYDTAVETMAAETAKDLTAAEQFLADYDPTAATDEEIDQYATYSSELQHHAEVIANCETDILCHDYLESIDYEDGTLLDFFTQDTDDLADEIERLYPLVASLTAGQRAGLDFVMLQDLVMFAASDDQGYQSKEFDELTPASVYLGVDRAIHEKGGVALTSDALRPRVTEPETPEQSVALHVFIGMSATLAVASVVTFAVSASVRSSVLKELAQYNATIEKLNNVIKQNKLSLHGLSVMINNESPYFSQEQLYDRLGPSINRHSAALKEAQTKLYYANDPEYVARLEARSAKCQKLMIGSAVFTVVMVGISAYLVYLDWQQMKAYYQVDFTPMPHYMIDEKDLVSYNKKGEKVVLKNQSAYYKLVECNRTANDEYYEVLGTGSDLNGDVGKQWLALYSVKKDLMEPILASSLKVVVGKTDIPAGYETGIHMFGTDAAFNLNSSLYDWANDAPSVYIYFRTDDTVTGAAGSNFTAGTLALGAGAGLILGAAITALAMKTRKKSDKKEAVAE